VLRRNADLGTVDKEKRTVEMTFSTGARVLRNSFWDGPSYEELSLDPAHVRMGRLQSGTAPFLKDHRASLDTTIGVIQAAKLERQADGTHIGAATVRFPKPGIDASADAIFEKIADGIIRNVSVGYRTYKSEQTNKAERGATPIFRATDWEPHEISGVAIGADADAGFRSDDPTQFNPCVFVTREQESEVTKEELEALLQKARGRSRGEGKGVRGSRRGADQARSGDEEARARHGHQGRGGEGQAGPRV
jgi:hypothetical protein